VANGEERNQIRCAICSKGHRRDGCTNKDSSQCPARSDTHTVFNWAYKLYPQQYRHVEQQKAKVRQDQRSAAMDIDVDSSAQTSLNNASSASGWAHVVSTASTSNTPRTTSC
jgi:hypothetical protein